MLPEAVARLLQDGSGFVKRNPQEDQGIRPHCRFPQQQVSLLTGDQTHSLHITSNDDTWEKKSSESISTLPANFKTKMKLMHQVKNLQIQLLFANIIVEVKGYCNFKFTPTTF